MGTMDALVEVSGTLQQSPPESAPCQLYVVEASANIGALRDGRDIRGEFSKSFIVHPWSEPYRAVVKCGDRVRASKEIEYREFPYKFGVIAP